MVPEGIPDLGNSDKGEDKTPQNTFYAVVTTKSTILNNSAFLFRLSASVYSLWYLTALSFPLPGDLLKTILYLEI